MVRGLPAIIASVAIAAGCRDHGDDNRAIKRTHAAPIDALAASTGSGGGSAGFGTSGHVAEASGAGGNGGGEAGGGSGSAVGATAGAGGNDEQPEPPADPSKALAELHAISAWQAVVDRTQYVARRGQHGAVYGTLGGAVLAITPAANGSGSASGTGSSAPIATAFTWLVDDTEGSGSLAIRVKRPLAAHATAAAVGDRVALTGAWALDDDRRWYWAADTETLLPAAKPTTPAPAAPAAPSATAPPPNHTIAAGDLPAGAHTITIAKEGELAYFMLVGPPPTVDGEGWPVANELGDPVYALLTLPGERASYGGQDMRAPDERWSLRRGVTYVVRLGHIRARKDKPALITARTAPMRVL